MLFLLQEEAGDFGTTKTIESLIVKDLIKLEKYSHKYISMSLQDFYTGNEHGVNIIKKEDEFPTTYKDAIPIGTIEFVTSWLRIFHGIEKENPIEIPPVLRTYEFLKRDYSIREFKDIPTKGRYFLKDASQLKGFSFSGDLEDFFKEKEMELDKTHLYQVSEIMDIHAEFRVYIIDGEIVSIENYNGYPLVFPDINLIKKANLIYSIQKDYPRSYSMDVMITDRGTSIIEIHNFTSLGLYSTIWGTNLLYAYRDGIDYLVNHNTLPSPSSNGNI